MANLGAGVGSSYPNAIDSRQVFRNGSTPAPDSDTRIDAEAINDSLASIIAIETTLGAGVNGQFGSLAARLNQAFPGGGGVPGVVTFTRAHTLTIPGVQHNVGQAALLWQLYDNSVPARAIEPGSVSMQVSPTTYDVTLAFPIELSGALILGAQSPLHLTPFVSTATVSVPGTVHQLPTADILFQVYLDDGSGLLTASEPGSLTVDPVTRDVLMQFTVPLSGTLVLSAGGPAYALTLSGVSTLTIPGSVHLLGTPALLFQLYDDQTPRNAIADPDVRVNPTTFDIDVAFGVPLSGRLVFGAASTLTGKDFDIRDAGIVNQSAVRVASQNGELNLQAGANNRIHLLDKTATQELRLDWTTAGLLSLLSSLPLHVEAPEFALQDDGVANVSKTGIYSSLGRLILQPGGGTSGQLIVVVNSSGVSTLVIEASTPKLGLGINPSHQLELAANDAVKPGGGSWLAPSTTAVKEDIQPFTDGLDILLALEPVTFAYNGLGGTARTGEVFVGLLAEAVRAVAPYLVRPYQGRLRPEGPETELLALDSGPLLYVMLNTIKTLHRWLLEARQAQHRLEQQVALLAARLDALDRQEEIS